MNRQRSGVAAPVMLALLLSACGSHQVRRDAPTAESSQGRPPVADTRSDFARACAPTLKHDESLYTPGGLYAPGISDTAPAQPIDVSGVAEPVPREEPRSRYGNRTPYVVLGKTYKVLDDDDARDYHARGVASWYGTKFNGRATSSGELYDICAFTAAHKTLPLPSYVRVTNLDNGRSLIVRVNDRGPFHDGRVMDLSYAAAVRLGVDRTGTAHVDVESVGPGDTGTRFAQQPPAAVPEPVPTPSVPGDDLTLQLGSFAERENARRLQDRLEKAGIDEVDIDHVEREGRDLWRVRVGPVAAADFPALRERLRALELPEPRVVRD
jgi:rare lipoprotein A